MRIEHLFKQKAIHRAGITLYSKEDAILFVEECESRDISILGIDGFYITQDRTEPSMENSIDFTFLSEPKEKVYEIAKKFLQDRNCNLFFEIVY